MTAELLARSAAMAPVRAAARRRILTAYDLRTQIPLHTELLLDAYDQWERRPSRVDE